MIRTISSVLTEISLNYVHIKNVTKLYFTTLNYTLISQKIQFLRIVKKIASSKNKSTF